MGGTLTRIAIAGAATAIALGFAMTRSTEEAFACGAGGPYDFDTYEAEEYLEVYARAIELTAAGKAVPSAWSVAGEAVDLRYQGLQRGPRDQRVTALDTALTIPPTIFKSIVWIEANWAQAAGAVPWGGVGPTLRSFDCGYGLGQITSGMSNSTGTPSAKQALIGTHFLFNLAEGARILADKWNQGGTYRPIAGEGDPAMLEDWYYAIWSYNGFAFTNHPLNPNRDPLRGGGLAPIYHCYDPSAPSYQVNEEGAVMFGYGAYTYPERVYGCMRHPPLKNGLPLWPAQEFTMPDLELEEVAAAFDPEHFLACEEAGFSTGCPEMDFPTTIEREGVDVKPHPDTTPPVDPALAAAFLGDPQLRYSGPGAVSITVQAGGIVTGQGEIHVENAGTWIAPFRIRTSAPWIRVYREDDPDRRPLDASVAIGAETEVVTQAASPGPPPRERQARNGYDVTLVVTVDWRSMPAGTSEGRVWIEPLLGGGGTYELEVSALNRAVAFPHRVIAPQVASD